MRRVSASLLIPLVIALGATPACFPDFEVNGDGGPNGSGDGGGGNDGGANDATIGSGDDDSGSIVTLPDGAKVLEDGGPIPTGDDSGPATGADGGPGYVPPGTFTFLFADQQTVTATFTHGIFMDVTEVTVAQFTAWVNGGRVKPNDGQSLDPSGPYQNAIYWKSSWNTTTDQETYKAGNGCQYGQDIFTDGTEVMYVAPTYGTTPDTVPINCVNWYQAVAYCASVGKRLATQAEFQYEATGRGHGYTYPWGDAPDPTDCSRAIWIGDGGLNGYNGCGFPVPVGSAPLGKSLDGVLDLEGSVEEWIWDAYNSTESQWPPDYAGPSPDAGDPSSRMVRSGSWISPKESLDGIAPGNIGETATYTNLGIRCVKTKL